MKVAGIIDSITSKTVSNGGTVFNALIDGNEVNLGFQCDYKEGEYAEIEVENTKWGLQVPRKPRGNSKPSAGSGATTRPAPAQSGSNKSTYKAFPVDPNTKDHSIIRQNALTNANTAVANACVNTNNGFAGLETREDYYNEVIQVAYNLAGFAMGTLDDKLVEEAQKQEARNLATAAENGEK